MTLPSAIISSAFLREHNPEPAINFWTRAFINVGNTVLDLCFGIERLYLLVPLTNTYKILENILSELCVLWFFSF